MTELEQYIQSYFGVVNTNELSIVSAFFKEKSLKKGDFFLKEGKYCHQLAFVKDGLLRIFTVADDGKEVTQWISTKGYFVTDLSSFIFEKPARWAIQTLSDSALYTIDAEAYKQLGEKIPQWHILEKMFLVKCFTTLENRVYTHLSLTAEERYKGFFEQNPALFNQVPLQYLASMLGMTPETFSRIRKKQGF